MERVVRLARIMGWLPAFRAVAETEHLQEAAKLMHVAPSALSRSVRLLEEDLGCELFQPSGRGIELTNAGREFASIVREAMRMLDDGILRVSSKPGASVRVRLATTEDLALALLFPAMDELMACAPIDVRTPPLNDVRALLLQGHVDLVIGPMTSEDPSLSNERIGSLAYRIFCEEGHALAGRSGLTIEEVLQHDFVVIERDEEVAQHAWPPEHRRRVALSVDTTSLAVAAAKSGRFLVLLPSAGSRGLRPVQVDIGLTFPLYAVRRVALDTSLPALDAITELLRTRSQNFA